MTEMVKEIKTSWMSKRDVLWIMVFCGFAVNYMIRINLNIAIVAMVRQKRVSMASIAISSECLRESRMLALQQLNNHSTMIDNDTISESNLTQSLNEIDENNTSTIYESNSEEEFGGFEWNEYEQGLILGAFFWLHWSTQIPGGLLAGKYGTKLIFGLANFSAVLCCFLVPFASYQGWKTLIFVRCLQGIVAGFAWPAMHNMTAKWIPPNERGKFVTAYLGSSVGAALTFPMCGYIIDLFGWKYVFHISGFLGSVWFLCWWMLVYDSPAQHPTISEQEKDYIHECLGQSVAKDKAPVPWRCILTSVPIWMNILAQWGGIWGLFTLMTHAPSYFKYIHGWNIRMTGLLSGMPHMLRMLFAYLFSLVGDYLLRTNKMSRTNVRKLATGFCTIGQAICMLALSYSGCNAESAIIFLTLATAIHGSVSSGPLASFVDISPNYASVTLGLANTIVAVVGFLTPLVVGFLTFNNKILTFWCLIQPWIYVGVIWATAQGGVCLGICGMIAVLPGFISPAVVGVLTYKNNTVGQWQMVFLIAVAMLMVSGVAYCLFSRSELEPWNSPEVKKSDLEAELKPLQHGKESEVIITEKEKL